MYYGLENIPLSKTKVQTTQKNEGITIKRFLNLNKKARPTRLFHALYIEPAEVTITKQKLIIVKRLLEN